MPDWMSPEIAAQLNLGFDVLVPDTVPAPFSGEPDVEAGDGYYRLYWANFGGAPTFLEITGTVGGQIPAYSIYDRNNQLTINASVQGNDAYHDVTPVYDMVYWQSGGVVYSVSSRNLTNTDTLSLADSLEILTPSSSGGNGGDNGNGNGDASGGSSAGGETATAAPPAPNAALDLPGSVQAGQVVTIHVSGVSNVTLEADGGTFLDTGDTSYSGVSDGSYRWQAPSPASDETVSIRLTDPDNGDWLASADVTVHGQGAPPTETAVTEVPSTAPTEAPAETAVPDPPVHSSSSANANDEQAVADQTVAAAPEAPSVTATATAAPTPRPTPTKSIFDSLPTSTPHPSGQPGDGTWGSQNAVKLPTARAMLVAGSAVALPSPPAASKETAPRPVPIQSHQPQPATTPARAKAPVVTGMIGPRGGELVNPAGAKLDFPTGALTGEATVRIAQLPDEQLPVSANVDLIPGSGFDITLTPVAAGQSMSLQKPVILTLVLDPGKRRSGTVIYWLHDGTLSPVAHSQLGSGGASVALSHFSRYVAGVAEPDRGASANRLAWILAAIGSLIVLMLLAVIVVTARRWRRRRYAR